MRVDVLLFPGFDELDAIAPYEVFQNAAKAGADFSVRLVAPAGIGEVTASHGLRVRADAALADPPRPDLVLVPGGGWNDRSPQGARGEAEKGEIPAHLAKLHQAGTKIAAVCTGAMLVAAAGLVRGRPATTHHGALEDLRAAGAEIIDARVVDDGDLLTAGGVTSGLDLALLIVERFASPALAERVSREMEYERRGVVWRRQALC